MSGTMRRTLLNVSLVGIRSEFPRTFLLEATTSHVLPGHACSDGKCSIDEESRNELELTNEDRTFLLQVGIRPCVDELGAIPRRPRNCSEWGVLRPVLDLLAIAAMSGRSLIGSIAVLWKPVVRLLHRTY